ncbi:MAG: hypothetical protein ACKVQJ_12450 [Pyrinomonadaceae bacterium]
MLRLDPTATGVAAVAFFMGGVLRMIYALMFESAEPGGQTLEEKVLAGAAAFKAPQPNPQALPPQISTPIDNFIAPATGNWRNTNDLQPTSVVEGTTKLLEKDETI